MRTRFHGPEIGPCHGTPMDDRNMAPSWFHLMSALPVSALR